MLFNYPTLALGFVGSWCFLRGGYLERSGSFQFRYLLSGGFLRHGNFRSGFCGFRRSLRFCRSLHSFSLRLFIGRFHRTLAGLLDEGVHRVRRLGADAEPVINPVEVQGEIVVLEQGIVRADLLDNPAITRRTTVCHHNSVNRCVLLSETP